MGDAFDVSRCLDFALGAMHEPPREEWIERVEPEGRNVVNFVLPLDLCAPFNRIGRAGTAGQGWKLGHMKKRAFELMLKQARKMWPKPLSGRPHVLCVRFSSVATDSDSGWSKNPVDRLRVGKNGLGILADDKPKNVKLSTWWEYAPPKKGFVFVSVWTGEKS